jgi:hypothetical protein
MAGKKKAAKKAAPPPRRQPNPRSTATSPSQTGSDEERHRRRVRFAQSGLIKKNVGKRGPGVFTVPGLMKITVRTRPATPARKGINPFTGEPTTFKAKPARRVVKVTALKGLKEMA